MKKNLPIIIIAILLVVIVVVSFYFMINKNNKPSDFVVTNNPIDVSEPHKDIVYAYRNNVSSEDIDLNNDFEDNEAFRTINGKDYKNINSIPANSIGTYNYNKYIEGSIQYMAHDINEERLFNEDRIIIPMAIFLMDDNVNVFYNYYDEIYFIPVIKCDNEDEERIVFRDHNLTIMKNGAICINGKRLDIDYSYEGLDFNGLFNSYFILNPELSNTQINLYKTNIDMNDSTFDYRLIAASNSDSQLESLCNTFIIIKEDGSFDLFVAPMDLGMHVDNYSNLFYKESNSIQIDESGEILDSINKKEYYLFDNGFKVIVGD